MKWSLHFIRCCIASRYRQELPKKDVQFAFYWNIFAKETEMCDHLCTDSWFSLKASVSLIKTGRKQRQNDTNKWTSGIFLKKWPYHCQQGRQPIRSCSVCDDGTWHGVATFMTVSFTFLSTMTKAIYMNKFHDCSCILLYLETKEETTLKSHGGTRRARFPMRYPCRLR
jgi:hypothetical protein